MAATRHDGATAPGLVTPRSDDARELAGCAGTKGQGKEYGADCAVSVAGGKAGDAHRKRLATLTARAALLGLELHELPDGTCILVGEAGQRAQVPSLQAAEALVWGCEQVRAEVAAMAGRLGRWLGARA